MKFLMIVGMLRSMVAHAAAVVIKPGGNITVNTTVVKCERAEDSGARVVECGCYWNKHNSSYDLRLAVAGYSQTLYLAAYTSLEGCKYDIKHVDACN